jgi:hypothetical protein
LGVVAPQIAGGLVYEFVSWSDGGAATHTITTPSQSTTYTATFRVAITTAGRCDINGDNAIHVGDIQRLVNVLLGAAAAGNEDLNRDGVVNTSDLQVLINVVIGVGSCPG